MPFTFLRAVRVLSLAAGTRAKARDKEEKALRVYGVSLASISSSKPSLWFQAFSLRKELQLIYYRQTVTIVQPSNSHNSQRSRQPRAVTNYSARVFIVSYANPPDTPTPVYQSCRNTYIRIARHRNTTIQSRHGLHCSCCSTCIALSDKSTCKYSRTLCMILIIIARHRNTTTMHSGHGLYYSSNCCSTFIALSDKSTCKCSRTLCIILVILLGNRTTPSRVTQPPRPYQQRTNQNLPRGHNT